MKIEHVAFYVQNLEKTKDFFVRFFRARASEKYYNSKTGFSSYFLSFSSGARLEIMVRPEGKTLSEELRGLYHIAFSVGSQPEVDALTSQLVAAGYDCISGPRRTGDGYYESCLCGPEGILVEITE